MLEHGIGLSFSDMVQQTCRNHRIHFFPHYKIIVQTDRKRINHWVNTVQIQINLECFKQKKYITWPLSDRIRPGQSSLQIYSWGHSKKIQVQEKILFYVFFFAREEVSCFRSFSPFPYSPGELEKGKEKRGEGVVPFPLPQWHWGKGGERGLTCQGQCEQPCNLVSQTNWGHPFCHVLQLALEACAQKSTRILVSLLARKHELRRISNVRLLRAKTEAGTQRGHSTQRKFGNCQAKDYHSMEGHSNRLNPLEDCC